MKTNEQVNKIMNGNEKIEAPIFGLEKWRKEHGLNSPEMEAYVTATINQKACLIFLTLILSIVVNYIKYGVP